jgi:hypothetical protein
MHDYLFSIIYMIFVSSIFNGIFAEGFVALCGLLMQSKSSRTASAPAWVGFATSNNSSSEPSLQAIDGIALIAVMDTHALHSY